MLKHWRELSVGTLVYYEGLGKAPDHWRNWYFGIYTGDGWVYELHVGSVGYCSIMHRDPSTDLYICGLSHEWHRHNGLVNLEDAGRVLAYNINGENEMMGLTDIGMVIDKVRDGKVDPAWLILDYRPKQEFTVDELSKLVGRRVKIVGGK